MLENLLVAEGAPFVVFAAGPDGELPFEPTTVALAGGGYVALWVGETGHITGTNDNLLRAQIYSATGEAVGDPLAISPISNLPIGGWSAIGLTDGSFAVAWSQGAAEPLAPNYEEIYVRTFSPDGAELGPQALGNTTIPLPQQSPDIFALADGSFVVTWHDTVAFGGAADVIRGQIFDSAGQKIGGEITVGGGSSTYQANPVGTALANGNFLIIWHDSSISMPGDPNGANQYLAQLFDTSGAKLGGAFTLAGLPSARGPIDITALPNGGFIASSDGNLAQVYDASAHPVGSPISVGSQIAIAVLDGGFFAVGARGSTHETSDFYEVQLYDATGTPIGAVSQVSSAGHGSSDFHLVTLADGDLVASWRGEMASGAATVIAVALDVPTFGTPGDDVLTGGDENDRIVALAGDDTLTGGGGNDTLDGGTGADIMIGGTGDDTYFVDDADTAASVTESAGQGYDRVWSGVNWTLTAGQHIEELVARNAAETSPISLSGNELDNRVVGSAGVNTLTGGGGNDQLEGLDGSDILDGGDGNDVIIGGGAGDELQGSLGNDALYGEAGQDVLRGGSGADTLIGGADSDWYFIDIDDTVVEAADFGNADMITADYSYALPAGLSIERLATPSTAGLIAIDLFGNEIANAIFGNAAANVLSGNAGNDLLVGHGGNDTLIGGAGIDSMIGGLGDDTYHVDGGADVIGENAGEGFDRVLASVSYTLTAGRSIEVLETDDPVAAYMIGLTGNELANHISGNAGSNLLNGGGGNDTLTGLGGNDVYIIDSAADLVFEAASGGADKIHASVSYTLGAGVHVEELYTDLSTGTVAINLTGNELANSLLGNAGANVLNGGAGADRLAGLGGNDSYLIDDVGDVVVEGAGGGSDKVFAGVSYTLAAGVQVEQLHTLLAAATSAIDLTGNELANALFGNAGANVLGGHGGNDALEGSLGDDLLDGGIGSDTLRGGGGDDRFVVNGQGDAVIESGGQGSDTVFASASYTLASNTEVEVLRTTSQAGTAALNLTGNGFSQTVLGNNGANVLSGGSFGDDVLAGFGGNDSYVVNSQSDQVIESGGQGSDTVFASVSYGLAVGAEVEVLRTTSQAGTSAINLVGSGTVQTIVGNAGANTIDGRGGNDTLYGMGGADSFAFRSALGAGNVDTLADYSVADDRILIDDAVFAGLAAGVLAAGAFNTGAAASQADDRIVYNSATGALLFDADGSGAGAAVHFATLSTGLAMTAGEFVVI